MVDKTEICHFQATSHYHANRFSLASDAFLATLNTLNDSEESPSSSSSRASDRDIFNLLSRVALKADQALCLFRSHMSRFNSNNAEEAVSLLLKAREANEEYLNTLEEVVDSFEENVDFEDLNYSLQDENSVTNQFYIVSKIRVDVSLALLMTGVSGLWLNLHNIHNTARTESETDSKQRAKLILCKAIRVSGCCFLKRDDMSYMPTWNESLVIIHRLLGGSKLEYVDKGTYNIWLEEKQRIVSALRSVRHALMIVDLCSSEYNTVVSRKRKRMETSSGSKSQKLKSGRKSSIENHDIINFDQGESWEESDDEEEDYESSSGIQQLLTKALWHQSQLRYYFVTKSNNNESFDFHRKNRNMFIERALELDQSSMATQISLFISMLDTLMFDEQTGSTDNLSKWTNIISKIEAMSSPSHSVLSLLGCIYTAKCSDAQKGLDIFHKVLQNHGNREGDVENTLSNISTCYAMLGHPTPVVELLIHIISLSDKKSPSKKIMVNPICMDLYHNDQTGSYQWKMCTLWRLYYAASLTCDWETCYRSIEEMHGGCLHSCFEMICIVYAKLEGGMPIEALEICSQPTSTNRFVPSQSILHNMLSIAKKIFSADSIISSKLAPRRDMSEDIDIDQITKWMSDAIEVVKAFRSTRISQEASQLLSALEVHILNNHALALVLDGKTFEALPIFLKAANLLKGASRLELYIGNNLQPYFNMVIILLRERFYKEAVKIWMNVRNFMDPSTDLEKARRAVEINLKEQRRRNLSSSPNIEANYTSTIIQYESLDAQILQYAVQMKNQNKVNGKESCSLVYKSKQR